MAESTPTNPTPANPPTSTMNISLPEPLKRFVDAKVASGLYGSASEFVREAIRERMKREEELDAAKAKLRDLLLEALESGGESIEFTSDFTEKQKQAFIQKMRKSGLAA